MTPDYPRVDALPEARARLRSTPEDFCVSEDLGFEPSGEGEHAFLYLEKRALNTNDLVQRVSQLSGVAPAAIGFSGLKDRNAVTRQWLSVGLAGRSEPDWRLLETGGEVAVLEVARHKRKLRRGVHRANSFVITLRDLTGDRAKLEQRLTHVCTAGVPNYFGEQRFGINGSTLRQARHWMDLGGRRITRTRRSHYISALRAALFNELLADRVQSGDWNRITDGDVCMLRGTHSVFTASESDPDLASRAVVGDIHPALPLWGAGDLLAGPEAVLRQRRIVEADPAAEFLVSCGLTLSYRAARVFADDFCWQFCDDESLQLNLSLPAGSYATAVLKELVQYQ